MTDMPVNVPVAIGIDKDSRANELIEETLRAIGNERATSKVLEYIMSRPYPKNEKIYMAYCAGKALGNMGGLAALMGRSKYGI